MYRYGPFNWILLILSSLVLLFIVAPLAGLFLHTGGKEIFEAAGDKAVQDSIILTVLVSFAATLLFSFATVPFAWVLARRNFPLKNIVQGIVDLPVVLPHTAAGVALLGFISREGILGKAASTVGLNLIDNPVGIALAMAFVSLPFLVNSARDGFSAVPERLEKAALNLGAGRSRVFFTISMPLAWRSIVTGFIMMFARGMSEFGAVVIIAYNPMIAPVMIFDRFNSYGLKYARPVAVLFVIVSLVVFTLLRLLAEKQVLGKTENEHVDY